MALRVPFYVVRRCPDGCEPGCNCALPIVEVDVDELLEDELEHFTKCGSEAQRAEIRAWLAGEDTPPAASPRPIACVSSDEQSPTSPADRATWHEAA